MKTRAERLIELIKNVYPSLKVNIDSAFEYIENGGQIDVKEFSEWLKTNNLWYV